LTPDFYSYTGTETWFDRAHNTIFDMLTMFGGLGLISYLSIYAGIFYVLWRFYKKQGYIQNIVILGLLFVAYFIQNVFVFDSINTYIPFFMLLGFVDHLGRLNNEESKNKLSLSLINFWEKLKKTFIKEKDKVLKISPSVAIPVIAIAWLVLFISVDAREMRANQQIYNALMAINQGNYDAYYQDLIDARDTALNHIDPIFLLAQGYPEMILNFSSQMPQQQYQNLLPKFKENLKTVIDSGEKGISYDPLNVFNYFMLANLYSNAAYIDNNVNYLNRALDVAENARKIAPNRLDLLWLIARIYANGSRYQDAISVLDQSTSLNKNMPYPYWLKYLLYSRLGDNNSAFQNATLAINNGYQFNSEQEITSLLPHYQQTKENDILAILYQDLITMQPKTQSYYDDLINLYLGENQVDKANQVTKQLLQAIPDAFKGSVQSSPTSTKK